MARVRHVIDKDTGDIVREVKVGNKITYETISQDKLDNYETGSNLFGCVGAIVGFMIFLWILRNIFGTSL
jgi:hypothetical protein